MVNALKVFGYIWLTVAGFIILSGMVSIWMESGFSAVQELMSPYNITAWLIRIIILASGIATLMWSQKLQDSREVTK